MIHQIILTKSFSAMCANSDRDDGIDLDEYKKEEGEGDEDKVDTEEVAIDVSRSNSRTNTPTVDIVADTNGGVAIFAIGDVVNLPSVPHLA
jgi:hypothetical protein